jgi:hypothetical protein
LEILLGVAAGTNLLVGGELEGGFKAFGYAVEVTG